MASLSFSLLFIFFFFLCPTSSIRLTSSQSSSRAVREVLARLPYWISEEFPDIEIAEVEDQTDEYVITVDGEGRKTVLATSTTAALYGINHFLRTFCNTQIAWDKSSFGSSCQSIRERVIKRKAPSVRYFGNPCTFSYSFAWWKWKHWERMLDWLALNGFNMVLAQVGQEALWRDVFLEMGVKRRELDGYFTGPAHLAWHRMGNLQGWGGPLSDQFLDSQLLLNQKIVGRMVQLGITPVLPTFAGFVPESVISLYPDTKFLRNECWNEFNETFSCLYSVHPNSPLFGEIAEKFMLKQKEVYGDVTNVFSADPSNEMKHEKEDLRLLKDTAAAVYRGCQSTEPDCIWVLQSWTFSYDKWSNKAVKAFLSGVPLGGLLVLDLHAEQRPLWREFNSFYGHAFVWCMLHNFGGTTELRGNLKQINKEYQMALKADNMMGAGLSMEAIGQNYVVYQFMVDRMWTDEMIPMLSWLETFVSSRYGGNSNTALKAWSLMVQSFYSEPPNNGTNEARFSVFIYKRPQFGQRIRYWFESKKLSQMATYFNQVKDLLWHNALFRMDYNDVNREKLQYELGNRAVLRIYEGYGLSDNDIVMTACQKVQHLFTKIETHCNDELEEYDESARALATSEDEAGLFSQNARDLITTWGPDGQILDYGRREWSGLIQRYYARRWAFFCEWIVSNSHFNRTRFDDVIFKSIERPFVTE